MFRWIVTLCCPFIWSVHVECECVYDNINHIPFCSKSDWSAHQECVEWIFDFCINAILVVDSW